MVVVSSGMVACGGGGGSGGAGSGSGSSSAPRHPRSFFETEEYFASAGLDAIGASSAYAGGASGQGITVGVIDTGIDIDHPEFAGAIDRDSIDIVGGSDEFLDDLDGHGTAVAGVIAARRNGELSHGVAFESRILAVRADLPGSCASGCLFDPVDVAAATDHAVVHGARVINYSLGGTGGSDPTLSAALAQATKAGRILVLSAGNSGADEPLFPAEFAATSAARGRALAVGALDADGEIATFSNRAGSAADHFLVAPGVDILAPIPGGSAALVSGTSFAAPHVTGAAALVLQAAPFLSATEVVELLLGTATDLGAPGTDPIYGRGALNLRAALAPQGTLQVPLDDTVEGAGVALATTDLRLGAAFGAGPELGRSIFLDGYGRAYWLDLDRHRRSTRTTPNLHGWLVAEDRHLAMAAPGSGLSLQLERPAERGPGRAWSGDPPAGLEERFALEAELGDSGRLAVTRGWSLQGHFGLMTDDWAPTGGLLSRGGFASPYLSLVDGGDGLALSQGLGHGWSLRLGLAQAERGQDPHGSGDNALAIGELAWTDADRVALGLQLGQLREQDRLLDSSGGGALGLPDDAATTFFGLTGRVMVAPKLHLFGQAGLGLTRPSGATSGLLQDLSTVRSSSFGAGIARHDLVAAGDRLVLAVVQPLRVDAGSAWLDRPVGRSFDGRVLRRRDQIDLAPEGREIDLELGYRLALDWPRDLSVNWLTQLHPGHDPEAPPAHAIAVRLHHRF